jgi:hypothetical protein
VTLRFLCRFLHNIVAHEEKNKMGIKNIGIVIGPNLLRPARYLHSLVCPEPATLRHSPA